jgi:hypothetical protein
MNQFKKIFLAASSAALLTMTGNVFSATSLSAGSSQQVSVNVLSGCSVTAPAAFVFPAIPLAAVAPVSVSMGNATIACQTGGAMANLGIDAGLHASGTLRRMADGTNASFVSYTISSTSGGADIGTTGLVTAATNPFSRNAQAFPAATSIAIYGNLTAASTPTIAGVHSDTVNYYVDF